MINPEAFFKISYGLYIVSSGNPDEGNGFISNAVFQVTAEPARFAVCCNKDNYTAEVIKKHHVFAVSVLKQDADIKLIGTFGYKSGKDTDKLAGLNIIYGITEVPVVKNDCIAYIECKLVQTFDVGSHLIYIGEVVQAETLENDVPLTYSYYREVKKGMAPKNAPTYIDKSKLEKINIQGKDKYKCPACGYIYDPDIGDPDAGISPGTLFKDLPDNWVCPICSTEKEDFIKL